MATRGQSPAARRDAEELLALFGPPLLDALAAGDADTRRDAARALWAVADAEPSLVRPLADRLLRRLADADDRSGFGRALATLADDHPEAVRTTLANRDAPRRLRSAVFETDGWDFDSPSTASETQPASRGDADHRSSDQSDAPARTADGGTDAASLVRQVVDTDGPETAGDDRTSVVQRESTDDVDRGAGTRSAGDGTPGPLPPADEAEAPSLSPSSPDPAAVGRRKRIERAEESRVFRAIALLGSFEDISVLEPEQAVRYGSALRTRATIDGEDHGVAVRLVDLPESGEPRRSFAAGVAERLAAWDGVADHEGVLDVHDWGDQPRPWLATPYVDGSLEDRGRAPVEQGLGEAVHLARAVGHCHRNGVVHAGIDPRSVVYPDASLDGLPAPRLDNVGLLREVREHFDPAAYLDPRYAAPEYFDRSYGAVDQATDVYQLGATLYRLFTGRAPFTGSYDDVRAAVLDDHPPDPSGVADLPSALDPVFAKALATHKLTRYETVAALRADLEAAAERLS